MRPHKEPDKPRIRLQFIGEFLSSRSFIPGISINAFHCLPCKKLLLFLCFLWISTQDGISHWFPPPNPQFCLSVTYSCTGTMDIQVYIKEGLELTKDKVGKKDTDKTRLFFNQVFSSFTFPKLSQKSPIPSPPHSPTHPLLLLRPGVPLY